ncbi:MAG TPA: hypothetical protein VFI28_12745 [Candidatus Limnocylindrales bacterium]|nr:hypothetical protein [Candidatus Limnocylindrales bacterium]
MTAEFNWWLLLVGLVLGAGLTWLVLADLGPVSDDPTAEETEAQLEADWIAARFAERGELADPRAIAETLELDRLYRGPDPRLAPSRPRAPRSPARGDPDTSDTSDAREIEREAESDRTGV